MDENNNNELNELNNKFNKYISENSDYNSDSKPTECKLSDIIRSDLRNNIKPVDYSELNKHLYEWFFAIPERTIYFRFDGYDVRYKENDSNSVFIDIPIIYRKEVVDWLRKNGFVYNWTSSSMCSDLNVRLFESNETLEREQLKMIKSGYAI